MNLGTFIEVMERLAPPFLADDFDQGKIGLVVEGRSQINKVCCALDVTSTVIERAVDLSADMLVVHHTPIWTPLTQLTGLTAKIIKALFARGINLYVMHSNFDRADGGVNDSLCKLLSLTDVTPMSLGRVGSCSVLLNELSHRLGGNIRVWGDIEKLKKLAVVAGSGFDPKLMDEAVVLGADAFLSAEMKHSVARIAPLPCIESTHYALEAPAMKDLALRMGWEFIDDPPKIQYLT